MKKQLFKIAALLLCVCTLSLSLCGCGLLERFGITLPDLPFLQQKDDSTEFVLSAPTDFYAEPDWDSLLLATYYEGYTVTYSTMVTLDGVTWAQAEEGWFAIDGTKPVDILNSYDVQQDGYTTETVIVYDEPSLSSVQYTRLNAGSPVFIWQIAETAENVWGQTDNGWVLMDSIYMTDQVGQHHGFGVARENDVAFFSVPGVQSYVLDTAASGARFEILEQINIDGYWWGYTASGWVAMDCVYVEGTTGNRPCTAMVIDPTPLNVRLAPGTENEVLTTLHYGDYVTILEQITRNGKDWGYTGEGWIFMDLTEIQS